jgi:hypothetical protein
LDGRIDRRRRLDQHRVGRSDTGNQRQRHYDSDYKAGAEHIVNEGTGE